MNRATHGGSVRSLSPLLPFVICLLFRVTLPCLSSSFPPSSHGFSPSPLRGRPTRPRCRLARFRRVAPFPRGSPVLFLLVSRVVLLVLSPFLLVSPALLLLFVVPFLFLFLLRPPLPFLTRRLVHSPTVAVAASAARGPLLLLSSSSSLLLLSSSSPPLLVDLASEGARCSSSSPLSPSSSSSFVTCRLVHSPTVSSIRWRPPSNDTKPPTSLWKGEGRLLLWSVLRMLGHWRVSPHPSLEGRGSWPGGWRWLGANCGGRAKVSGGGDEENEPKCTVMWLIAVFKLRSLL
jgi:hypothetical protein